MNKIYGALVILAVVFGGWKLWEYWQGLDSKRATRQQEVAQQSVPSESFEGLPKALEPSLREAEGKGPTALKVWLDRNTRYVKDPRLAAIQLEYVVMLSRENPTEAKRVFAEVKARVGPASPVYPKIKALEKTYQ